MGEIVNFSKEEISIKEASKITGIKYHTLRKWIVDDEKIPYKDYNPLKRVLKSDIEAFMASKQVKIYV